MTPRILFVHNHATKFVQMDLALLRERYCVREWYQRKRTVILPSLAHAVMESDLVFGWFAGWHSFFPLMFARGLRRPSLLIVGGYDTANLPEIGYGSQRGGMKRWFARTTIRSATALVPFSMFAREEAARATGINPGRVIVIYLGLETRNYMAKGGKADLAITVGNVDRVNLQRKGLEPFVRAAALMPRIPFVVIGSWRDDAITYLRSIASPNVQFTGWVSDEELHDWFARARVYVQPSRHEGFGLSVAEAMLYECVPVATHVGSLPEVIGDAGVYLDCAAPQAIADGVTRAMALDAASGKRARERILREFPLEKRKAKLYELIDDQVSRCRK